MTRVSPHLHISGITGIIQALYVIAILGLLNLVAKRYENHPFWDAYRGIYGAA